MNRTSHPGRPQYEELLVIDELIVGPVKLEPKRVVAAYTILIGEESHSNELIYTYDESVFDPDNPEDLNLAMMITAQLAFNYGLFCRRIVFDGLLDATDQRFIRDMVENTSREIFVKKFLEPNQFISERLTDIEPSPRTRYTNAHLHFMNTAYAEKTLSWRHWPVERHRHCVLSSGGKDSLLSYGLLREAGKDVHAIFGNESGRHWFTALNAYRHLKDTDPNTTKVWMNSDRIFAWFLRHLSFVRPDFSKLRADDYPVRLWTVAVFLFGALPLMRKRNIGRLVIGDEYDSTQRTVYHGISHYNGLYDQSRFFDEALSRYFMKKGWGVSQFSVLRPLSELLILKILVKRYPELQAQQISCHAAHEEEGRIYPCGKCEKCRRIVGMLKAMDMDPTHCGYNEEQIDYLLKSLETSHVKQLGPEAAHLHFLLEQKGYLPTKGAAQHRSHPQVVQLRFDRERSPFRAMPVDLRLPLFRLMLEHVDGAVELQMRKWMPIALLSHPGMNEPFPFESDATETMPGLANYPEKFLWGEFSWEELEKRLEEVDVALLPVGAIEQHGPHLPLDVDSYDARYLAHKVAAACSHPKPLVLPLVPFGVSYHHNDFAGTISISNEAMSAYIYDIGMSLARNGIKKLLIINGHGDNSPSLNYAAQMINRDAHIFVGVDTGETSDADIEHLIKTPNDIHAGEVETSTSLANRAHLVQMERATDRTLKFSNRYLNFSSQNSVPWYAYTKKISDNGVMGNPTLATVEKGQRIWSIMIAHLVNLVEDLKRMTLDEIHQRRY